MTEPTTLQYNNTAMIESVIEKLTEAIEAQTAVMEKALPLLSAAPAAEAPAKAEKPKAKPKKVKEPESEAPVAEETPEAEETPAVDRAAGIAKITEAFKAKLVAAPEEGRQGLKDKFTALRGDFGITTINDLPDDKLDAFHDAMVERVV